MNENKKMNIRLPFDVKNTMTEICGIKNGPTIMGAWGKDSGTMERRLKLALVYPDGEVSPIHEYNQSKLTSAKALSDLADMDGVSVKLVEGIYEAIMKKKDTLMVQADGSGKCSLRQVYEELCQYVDDYEEPGKVFIKDGYGNILSKYLPKVLDKLELGYTRLELERNFKAWGLLRVNKGTGHEYAYRINTGSVNDWYFSFVLPEQSSNESEAA